MNAPQEIGPLRVAGTVYWLRAFPRDQWAVTAGGVVIYGPTASYAAAKRELYALTED